MKYRNFDRAVILKQTIERLDQLLDSLSDGAIITVKSSGLEIAKLDIDSGSEDHPFKKAAINFVESMKDYYRHSIAEAIKQFEALD